MSHNPARLEAPFTALRDHAVLTLEGRDAAAFAHAQFMNDVAALLPGHWHWNGWLTPKGRVIALFALLKLDDARVWLLLQDVDAGALATQLRRFVFRSRVAIAVAAQLHVGGALQASRWVSGSHFVGDGDSAIELDMSGDGGGRSIRLVPQGTFADEDDAQTFADAWATEDLRHGWPRLPSSQSEMWTPQQLSLDRLRAYSIKKGCYPGQEIVARTHFLGQAKRGLILFETEAPLDAGAEIGDGSRTLGTVVSTARGGSGGVSLAVLPLERPGALTVPNGTALQERAMEDGLAR